MSLQLFISYAILAALPLLLVPVMIWMLRIIEQRMPPEQRAALDYFADKAVKYIEMVHRGTGGQKKDAAINMVYTFFKKINRPAPSYALIEAAIEALVWEMNQAKLPKEFMTPDDKPSINTGPIKPISPPAPGGQPA